MYIVLVSRNRIRVNNPTFIRRTAGATRRGKRRYTQELTKHIQPHTILLPEPCSKHSKLLYHPVAKMSYPVTEIAYIPINTSNYNLESGDGKKIWDATLKTISEQQGFKRLSWGFQIENPDVAQMAIGNYCC